jgi:putative ABC transport system permease protein
MDVPTGNISVQEARQIQAHPLVASSIPLALGDSYRGFRIVGTTEQYPQHYDATLATGAWWNATYEVTVGHRVAREQDLSVGDSVITAHGLTGGGHLHEDRPLHVVGIMAETGTIVDRLLLTSVETVWAVHGQHEEEDHEDHGDEGHDDEGRHGEDEHAHGEAHAHDDESAAGDETGEGELASGGPATPSGQQAAPGPGGMRPPGPPGVDMAATDREYTALLIRYSSPMAAVTFPRFVNRETDMMAASPASETARLFELLGVGFEALQAFGFILILAATLGIFIALYNAMQDRQYDLAVMRTLGASRSTLTRHVLLEGLLFAVAGLVLGLALGHLATGLLAATVDQARDMNLTAWAWAPRETWLVGLALIVGAVSALLPAVQAYRTDLAFALARE